MFVRMLKYASFRHQKMTGVFGAKRGLLYFRLRVEVNFLSVSKILLKEGSYWQRFAALWFHSFRAFHLEMEEKGRVSVLFFSLGSNVLLCIVNVKKSTLITKWMTLKVKSNTSPSDLCYRDLLVADASWITVTFFFQFPIKWPIYKHKF